MRLINRQFQRCLLNSTLLLLLVMPASIIVARADESDSKANKESSKSGSFETGARGGEGGARTTCTPATLIIAGDEVFVIRAHLGPYPPERRVETIQKIVKQLEQDPAAVDSISVQDTEFSTDVVASISVAGARDTLTVLTITDADARLAGAENRHVLAQSVMERLKRALLRDIKEHSFASTLVASAYTAGASVALLLCLAFTGWLFPQLYQTVERSRGRLIRSVRIQKTELLSQDTLSDLVVGVLRVVRVLAVLVMFSIYAPLVLSFFPDTRHLSADFINNSIQPLRDVVIPAAVSYIPNVAFMTAVVICTYYGLAITHFAFREIGRGNMVISGFDPEWSESTYKIARFLIIAFMFVMIYPYLPGFGSPAFQQVSIFLGILLSLGSTGSMSHIIAGVFLTYTRAFKIGDRVKIADTVGDVVEKTLLATRIRTTKHEYITIPNGLVLGSHIINYSSSAGNPGLILHTTLTIGYDASWKVVQQLLIDAALKTENVLSSPAPFVLQTSLDDFYVSYELNVFTNAPNVMSNTYSSLHQNIQDAFYKAGVEIMSPHYQTLRDGNRTTIPAEYLPKGYEQPAFVVAEQKTPPGFTTDAKS